MKLKGCWSERGAKSRLTTAAKGSNHVAGHDQVNGGPSGSRSDGGPEKRPRTAESAVDEELDLGTLWTAYRARVDGRMRQALEERSIPLPVTFNGGTCSFYQPAEAMLTRMFSHGLRSSSGCIRRPSRLGEAVIV